MPWIKEPVRYGRSFERDVNFLWKDARRPIYVMDNHLVAVWCWLQEVGDEAFGLVHIDYHWDANPYEGTLEGLDGRLSLAKFVECNPELRWNVYLDAFARLKPNMGEMRLLAKEWDLETSPLLQDVRFHVSRVSLLNQIPFAETLRLAEMPGPKILNLDIDYFFDMVGDWAQPMYSQAFIRESVRALVACFSADDVITIALSPECCGGYTPSAFVLRIILDVLGVEYPPFHAPDMRQADADDHARMEEYLREVARQRRLKLESLL